MLRLHLQVLCDYISLCFRKHHFTPYILSSKQHPRLSHVALEIPGQLHSSRLYGCILHGCPVDKKCKKQNWLFINVPRISCSENIWRAHSKIHESAIFVNM